MKRWWAVLTTAALAAAGVAAIQLWPDTAGAPSAPDAAARRARREPRPARLQDLQLAPPAGALTLGGRVVDDAGPVAGVTVAAFAPRPEEAHPLRAGCGCRDGCGDTVMTCGCPRAIHALVELAATGALERAPAARAVTDSAGRFQLPGLVEGRYELWAELDGAFASSRGEVAPADDVELRLSPGVSVRGVVEIEGGAAPEGTLVTAVSPAFPRALEAVTGPGGRFQLPPLPSLDFVAATELEGYLGAYASIADSDLQEGLVLKLAPARTISGVVLRDGRPVPGAEVWTDNPHLGRQKADGRGAFTLTGIPPGDITVRAAASLAYGDATVTVPLDRDVARTEIELEPRGALTGVVRDANGRPVEGASVGWSFGCSGQTARTDSAGRYLLENLDGGTVFVTASAEGFATAPGSAVVVEGEIAELDFTLQRGLSISGSVVDEAGQPLGGVRVAVDSGPSMPPGRDTFTSEAGQFQLDGLPAGALVLQIDHEHMLPAELEVHPPRSGIQIALRRGAVLRVRVVDGSGQPVPEADVVAEQLSGDPGGSPYPRDVGPGEHELRGLASGEYRIEASLSSVTASAIARVDGRTPRTVEVRLPQLGTIAGQVVGRRGEPVEGAWVRAAAAGLAADRTVANGSTGEEGRFELKVPLGQSYRLTSARPQFRESPPVLARPGGPPVTLVVEEPAFLRGRVLRSGGAPITAFSVNGERQLDAAGRYEVEVESGDVTLVFSAPDLAPAAVSVRAEAGATTEVPDVVLREGARVTARAVDAETGAPLKGATAWLSMGAGSRPDGSALVAMDRVTRSDGTVELPHVPPGAFLDMARQGYAGARVELRGEPVVEVKLQPLAKLRVQIAAPDGSPARGWWVMADGPVNRTGEVQDTGFAELSALDEGEYVLTAWQTPFTSLDEIPRPAPVTPVKVRVPASGTAVARMELRSGSRTVSVAVSGGDRSWKITPVLIAAGEGPLPESPDQLLAAANRLLFPVRPRTREAEFGQIGPGRYDLLALVEGPHADALYRDPVGLVVADQDVRAQLTIPPGWRPVRQ